VHRKARGIKACGLGSNGERSVLLGAVAAVVAAAAVAGAGACAGAGAAGKVLEVLAPQPDHSNHWCQPYRWADPSALPTISYFLFSSSPDDSSFVLRTFLCTQTLFLRFVASTLSQSGVLFPLEPQPCRENTHSQTTFYSLERQHP